MFVLIKNKYLHSIFLFTVFFVGSVAGFSSEFQQAPTAATQVSPKSLAPSERMGLLKLILARNPDMTMLTVLPELMGWWNRDIQFVRFQVEQRISTEKRQYSISPSEVTLHRIQLIDTMVRENTDHMSLAFLNFAWRLVVNALSSDEICKGKDERQRHDAKFNVAENETKKLAEAVEEYKRMITGSFDKKYKEFPFYELDLIYGQIRIQPGAFVVTHISKQGLVSIPTINEGLAFEVNDRAYAVCFVGVGTNPRLEYDGEHGDAFGLWVHDNAHYTANFPWTKDHEGKGTIKNALAFKERIKNVYDTPEVQLVLYAILHEGNQWDSNDFAKNIKHCTENVQKESHLLPSFVKSASYYGSGKRVSRDAPDPTTPLYLSAVKDAEWLKMNWPRKNGGAPFLYPHEVEHKIEMLRKLREAQEREAEERYRMRAEEAERIGTSADEDLKKELRRLLESEENEIYDRYEIQAKEIIKIGTLGDQYLRFYLKGIQLIKQELLKNYIERLNFGVFDYESAIGGLHLIKDHLAAQSSSSLEWKGNAKRNSWG